MVSNVVSDFGVFCVWDALVRPVLTLLQGV